MLQSNFELKNNSDEVPETAVFAQMNTRISCLSINYLLATLLF